jgi:hypothetical protein
VALYGVIMDGENARAIIRTKPTDKEIRVAVTTSAAGKSAKLKGNGWSYRSTAAWLHLCCSRAIPPTVSRGLLWFPNRPTRFHNRLTRSTKYSKIRPRQLQTGADGKPLAAVEQRRGFGEWPLRQHPTRPNPENPRFPIIFGR